MLPSDREQSVLWNQAVMELGAAICTAKKPSCDDCPLRSSCAFAAAGWPRLGEKEPGQNKVLWGTNRHVRGLILKALRTAPKHHLDYESVAKSGKIPCN